MTASLPPDVQAVLARFAVTELTTVDPSGQPVTAPVTASYRPGAPCIDVRTDLLDDARENPLVALLFSDPAGSGLEQAPMVLVQGSAQVEAGDCIRVRPERVYAWPQADVSAEPELFDAHMEEVRSGHSEEPDRYHADPTGTAATWSERLSELGRRHRTAVLSLISPDGFPFAVRVPVHVDAQARRIGIDGAPTGIPFQAGLACLTAYAPGEHGALQVRGDLVQVEGAWAVIPHRVQG